MKYLKTILVTVFAASLLVACGGGSSDNTVQPTKAMYDQIAMGMSYSQVVSIIGSEATPNNGFGNENPDRKSWSGGSSTNNTYSRITVCFPNNSVAYKFYEGPETNGKGIGEGNMETCSKQ